MLKINKIRKYYPIFKKYSLEDLVNKVIDLRLTIEEDNSIVDETIPYSYWVTEFKTPLVAVDGKLDSIEFVGKFIIPELDALRLMYGDPDSLFERWWNPSESEFMKTQDECGIRVGKRLIAWNKFTIEDRLDLYRMIFKRVRLK